ncbi:unnamed protein product [Auanema sp. JU1783]|nr:unnamed protein product [Auanema sp. JU1783]
MSGKKNNSGEEKKSAALSAHWQCFSSYLYLNPAQENAADKENETTVLYTRRYQYNLYKGIMVTRTATILREENGDDKAPLLHLLTVDLIRRDQVDEEARQTLAPDFNCVVFHDAYKTSFYVRFMKATQLFKMQNFPHLLKNHLDIKKAYYFGDLKVIENPHEMQANFMNLSLADDCTMMEVLVGN